MGTQALQIHIVETLAHLLSYIACSYDQWNLFKILSKSDLSTFFSLFFKLIWVGAVLGIAVGFLEKVTFQKTAKF